MNTYVITFRALNTKKEKKITCSAFVHSETLFLAVHSFEDKNRGRGYVITSVSELLSEELTAKKFPQEKY
ncbi:hypothetical protein K8Q80_25520 [Escherichia coli]|uniref:hypothetical protein n=1 Tax=Escherichia coli TaxID=562 RepID=UPI001FF078C0|nr:hypothetical protein [Escherichia coli]UPG28627.1 hypothetical protein J4W10_000120 [Escherichia coli]